jgi:serine/alanine adding enzyme
MLITSEYNSIDKKKWGDFIDNHPEGNIFQSPEMYKVYECTHNYRPVILAAMNMKNEIIAILLAVIIHEKSGLVGKLTARSIITGGPIFKYQDNETVEQILDAYKQIIGRKVIYTQIRNFTITNIYKDVFEKQGFHFEDHLNILLDMSIGINELLNNYSRSRKKGVKKGMKAGFHFESENGIEFLDIFYELVTTSYHRIKHPSPSKDYFFAICNNLNEKQFNIFGLKYKDFYVAGLLGLIHKKKFYGYYMGLTSNIDILKLKPSDLFFHHIFNWCIEKGLDTFDWLGAGKPAEKYGVRDFKLQFGGEVINPGRYQLIHKPFFYRAGKIALILWKKIKT